MDQEVEYPDSHCYFCDSLLYKGSCHEEDCMFHHNYHIKEGFNVEDGEISFIIDGYGFSFHFDGTMELCVLDRRGIIKEVIPFPEWLQVTKDNYLSVADRIGKLQVFA